MSNDRSKKSKRINTDKLVGFIGGYLVDQGAITLEQLDRALIFQVELAIQGEALSLGQVLQRLGYVNAQELAHAVTRQQQDMASHAG